MKRLIRICASAVLALVLLFANGNAQQAAEQMQPLNKASKKGMISDVALLPGGGIVVNYAAKGDKKSDENIFEAYSFDRNLKFLGSKPFEEPKETKPPITRVGISAFAGGTGPAGVLSQKLSVYRTKYEMVWDFGSQKYVRTKTLSKESVKLGNSEGRYKGLVEFYPEDAEGALVIGTAEQGKKEPDKFVCLFIDFDLNVTETPIVTSGEYALAFAGELKNGHVFVILAPEKSMSNTSAFVFAEFGLKGELVTRNTFNAPSPNMAVMDFRELNGALYLVGVSIDGKKSYSEAFTDFSSITNPALGPSWQSQKYIDALYYKEFDNFHFCKLSNGKLDFAGTTAIKEFKTKVKTPPSQKKEHIYTGKKLFFANLSIAPNGDYFVAGQLMTRKVIKEEVTTKYLDFIALHFDSKGQLKSQYAVEKVNDDTKSEIFSSPQGFFFSGDGKTAVWEVFEVKGTEGYYSFFDGFYGRTTFVPNYFPRLMRIDIATGEIQNPVVLAFSSKCYMYPLFSDIYDAANRVRYYIGHDADYKKLWIGRYNID